MKFAFNFNTNTLLQLAVLGVILYYSWGEHLAVVLPTFVGISYVAYTFTKNIMTSLIMAAVISYTLLVVLYKDHQREFFNNKRTHHTTHI